MSHSDTQQQDSEERFQITIYRIGDVDPENKPAFSVVAAKEIKDYVVTNMNPPLRQKRMTECLVINFSDDQSGFLIPWNQIKSVVWKSLSPQQKPMTPQPPQSVERQMKK